MASPFHVFRKHQRAMMAVVGILCMIGFSIAGVGLLDNTSDRSSRVDNPVVATAYGQTLRESDVAALQRKRGLAIRFMGAAIRSGMGELGRFINPEAFLENVFGPATEEAVVETWVLAERAKRLGMVVSDEAINDYLKRMTEDKVRPEMLRAIVKQQRSSQPEVFDALRHELLAFRLREMSLRNVEATPAQRWDYFRRTNQQAVAEVVPLPVEQFADEVSDPTDETLAAFFEANKDREPRPDSPQPGFKVPKKAAFEVVIARYEDFDDPDSVTEEEIKEFYEKHKDQRFLYSQHAFTDWEEEPAADEAADEKAGEEKSEKDTDQADADQNASDKKDAEKENSDKKNTDEKPGNDKAKESSKSPGKKDQSALRGAAVELVAALQQGVVLGGLLSADEDGTKESAAADDQPVEPTTEKSTDEPAATDGDKAQPGGNADEKPAAKIPKTKIPAIAPPITDELTLPRDIHKGANPKYAPLWKVERSIREELSRDKANEKIEKALQAVQAKMRQFSRARLGSSDKKPKIDLAKLADEHGLRELQTGLLTAYELQDKHPELAQARGEGPGVNFLNIGYSNVPVYQSTIVQDTDANRYLFWKTEDEPAYVPEFSEIRSKVLHTWKLVQAREIAEKKAQTMAAEAKSAGKPLKEVFADQEMTVVQTPPFSWMSRGTASVNMRSPLEVSEVEGVERPGADFMREVFNLGVGDVGAAMNQPQTIAYVIRVTSLQPPRELLRSRFMAAPFMLYAEAGTDHRQQIVESWRKGIDAEANLTWVKRAGENAAD
ncbi:MAG TPA: SurA N-terminal domain-containing protein [Pirellulales bacterium]|nr:SurA N-terminal domain-containing protein [Pirellulales bacterium]